MQKTIAYLRVSTDEQDINNQKHGLLEFANAHGITNIEFVSDTVTGKKHWKKRKLGDLVETLNTGDRLLFAEVSRIARSTLQVLEVLTHCSEKQIHVYIAKQNMVLDNSMQARITATVLGLAAEIEREFISQRTKEALAARKAAGVKLGRPKGVAKHHKLDSKQEEIKELAKSNLKVSVIARLVDAPRSTVVDYIKRKKWR